MHYPAVFTKHPGRVGAAIAAALALTTGAGAFTPANAATNGSNLSMQIEGQVLGGPITGGFNPFLGGGQDAWNMGATSMIYEPLLQFDILKPGTTHPWLASHYAWSNGGKTLTFTLRDGVKWSNGAPFTSADVVYTFDTIKANTAFNGNGISFTSISAPSANKVVMQFAAPAYTQFYAVAGQTLIVNKAKYSAQKNLTTYTDPNPVGTGPYVLKSINGQAITLTANPDYWQKGKPAIGTLVFPDYESNTTATSALQSGQLVWGGNFISHIQQLFANTPQHVFYSPPNNTVSLEPNMKTWPTSNLAVRQAISLAVNRKQVAQDGEDGDEAPATTATGLILPNDASYLTKATTGTLSPTANVAKAKAVLTKAGFTETNGQWNLKGRPVTLSLIDPSGYSDYMAADQAIAQELTSFGIKTTVDGVATNAWSADLQSGHFSITLRYGQTAATPYGQYEDWLDPTLIGTPSGNFERFDNPAATAALHAYASAGTTAAQMKDVRTLGSIVSAQLPVIPVMYGAAWGEYNSDKITGFPSKANPYDPAQPAAPSDEYVVVQLTPRG